MKTPDMLKVAKEARERVRPHDPYKSFDLCLVGLLSDKVSHKEFIRLVEVVENHIMEQAGNRGGVGT